MVLTREGWGSIELDERIGEFVYVSAAKTNAERQAAYRARKADAPELRGIFAHPDDHQAIRDYAAKLARKRDKASKAPK